MHQIKHLLLEVEEEKKQIEWRPLLLLLDFELLANYYLMYKALKVL